MISPNTMFGTNERFTPIEESFERIRTLRFMQDMIAQGFYPHGQKDRYVKDISDLIKMHTNDIRNQLGALSDYYKREEVNDDSYLPAV